MNKAIRATEYIERSGWGFAVGGSKGVYVLVAWSGSEIVTVTDSRGADYATRHLAHEIKQIELRRRYNENR